MEPENNEQRAAEATEVSGVQVRASAVESAAAALGSPKHYRKYTSTERPGRPRTGLMGAVKGGTDPGPSSWTEATEYPAALVQVADYIATGAIDADDLLPTAAALAQAAASDEEVEAVLPLLRAARGCD